jgi:mannosyltransferase OCH1-like enzyme/GT2 family glycosyltransferase
MAFYNRQALLDKTLESIHQSAIKDYELIIVDDASDVPLVCDEAKIIRVEKKDKWYTCSAVAFNRAFREATGDIIIIQNPECYHIGDVLAYATKNIKENTYLSFGCYAPTKIETTNFHNGIMPGLFNYEFNSKTWNGWYNHTVYRPVAYHFCSAIMRSDLDRIGGFDERYSRGMAYDDDDFIRRIERMGMNVKIVNDPYVIHQYHTHFEFEGNSKWRPLHALNCYVFKTGYNKNTPMDYGRNTDFFRGNSPQRYLSEERYNRFYLNYKEDKIPVIPRDIHMIWLGGELPPKYTRLIESWKTFHPKWNFKIWNDKDAQNFNMTNKVAFNSAINLGVKSDVFRYEILYRHGGLYVDTDFECLKSFDDLLYLDFWGGGRGEVPYLANGLMACKPKNELMKMAIDAIKDKQSKMNETLDKILEIAGVDFITDLYFKYIKTSTDKAVLFPDSFFYPMPNSFRYEIRGDTYLDRVRIKSYVKPSSYCVHLWYTSWIPEDKTPQITNNVACLPANTNRRCKVQQTSPIARRIGKIKYMKRRYGRRYPG